MHPQTSKSSVSLRRVVAAAGFLALSATGAVALAGPASAAPVGAAPMATALHSCWVPGDRIQHSGWSDNQTKHVHRGGIKKSHHKKSHHKHAHPTAPPLILCG